MHPPAYGIVVGWGKTSLNGKSSQNLQKTTIRLLTPEQCNATEMGKYQTDTVICGYEDNTDACQVLQITKLLNLEISIMDVE